MMRNTRTVITATKWKKFKIKNIDNVLPCHRICDDNSNICQEEKDFEYVCFAE